METSRPKNITFGLWVSNRWRPIFSLFSSSRILCPYLRARRWPPLSPIQKPVLSPMIAPAEATAKIIHGDTRWVYPAEAPAGARGGPPATALPPPPPPHRHHAPTPN